MIEAVDSGIVADGKQGEELLQKALYRYVCSPVMKLLAQGRPLQVPYNRHRPG